MAKDKNYISIELEGAAELQKVFAGLPKSVERRLLIASLKRVARPIATAIRKDAPKDSGDSKRSIKVRAMTKSKFPAITIGPDEKHWFLKFAELGSGRQAAKPFMRPVWDAMKNQAAKSFILESYGTIEKFAVRLRKQAYAGKLSRAGRKALGI